MEDVEATCSPGRSPVVIALPGREGRRCRAGLLSACLRLREAHGDARTEAFIDRRPGATRAHLGSAVKFGRVAEGEVDIYPRLGPTSEWDVAAGHAVVTAAGGKVTDSMGAELHFGLGREDFIVPEFIAWGDPAAAI